MNNSVSTSATDNVVSSAPSYLSGSGVGIDHANHLVSGGGGYVSDDKGLRLFFIRRNEKGEAEIMAGVVTISTPLFVIPLGDDIAGHVKSILSTLDSYIP